MSFTTCIYFYQLFSLSILRTYPFPLSLCLPASLSLSMYRLRPRFLFISIIWSLVYLYHRICLSPAVLALHYFLSPNVALLFSLLSSIIAVCI